MLSSCLVDDPPPFPESKQTPPRLDYHAAQPLLGQFIFAQNGETLDFSIPVASEDAGDDLIALLFLDYSGGAATRVAGIGVTASTLDDTTRKVVLHWPVLGISPGCHRLTLRVTHNANLNTINSPLVQNQSDLAEANWFAIIDADSAVANTLADCP